MNRQLTLGTKLLLGLGTSLGLALLLGGLSVLALSSIGHTVDTLAKRNLRKVELAGQINTATSDIVALERGIMYASAQHDRASVDQFARTFQSTVDGASRAAAEYAPMLETDEGRRLHGTITTGLGTVRSAHEELMQAVGQDRQEDAARVLTSRLLPQAESISQQADELAAISNRLGQQISATAQRDIATSTLVIGVLIAIALGAGVVIVLVIRRANAVLVGTIVALREGAEQVVSAAGQISSSSQTLSQGASEQAASLEETSASMEEMAAMTQKNAANAQQVASMMEDVSQVVVRSEETFSLMKQSVSHIEASSEKVSKIIKTIDEIAFQTNILALNAAVEAARAGEAGMGFAVVADEVRTLAQRSAQAAKDTAALIEEAIGSAHDGSARVQLAADSITSITQSVTQMHRLVREVSDASAQQSQGIEQVAQAVSQMEKVTQGNAAGAEESAAASEELNAQAETTMAEIERLDMMVTGGGRPDGRRAMPVRPTLRGPHHAHGPETRRPKRMSGVATSSAEERIPLGPGTYGSF